MRRRAEARESPAYARRYGKAGANWRNFFSISLGHSAILFSRNSCHLTSRSDPKSEKRCEAALHSQITSCKIHQKRFRFSHPNHPRGVLWVEPIGFKALACPRWNGRRGDRFHHNNRYAFLRYAMRPCSRGSPDRGPLCW
jgi:hypothetical protein